MDSMHRLPDQEEKGIAMGSDGLEAMCTSPAQVPRPKGRLQAPWQVPSTNTHGKQSGWLAGTQ
jgi:hypothetical protein